MGRARRLRYRHLRRTVIAVPAAIALVLLLLLGAQHALESPVLRQRVIRWLEDEVAPAAGVELDVGDLRWELVPPRMVLLDTTLSGAGIEAHVDRLRVDLAGIRWLRRSVVLDTVAADGVRLRVAELPRRSGGESPIHVVVRHLDLRDVGIAGLRPSRSVALDLAGVAASWSETDGDLVGWARVARTTVAVRGLEPFDVAVATRFAADGEIRLGSWRVAGDGIDVEGTGSVEDGRVLLAGKGAVDLAELDRVVRAKGTLEGTASVEIDLDSGRDEVLVVRTTARRLVAARFPLEEVDGRVALSAGQVRGSIEDATVLGGRMHADWEMRRGDRPRRHRVTATVRGMALDRFLETLGVPPATLAARVDVDAELGWNDADIRAGSGHGTARLHPGDAGTAVTGEVEARLAPPGLLHLTAEDLQVGHSTVRWQGPLTIGTWQPSWSVRADPAVLEELVPLVNAWVGRNVLPPDVEGRGELQVDLTGPWHQPGVVVRLEAQPLRWSPLAFDRVVAEGRISGDTLELGPARFRVGDGGGEVEGRLWWGDEPGVDLDWRGQSIPLSSIAGWVDLASTVQGRAAFAGGLRGSLELPRGSWALGVTDATLLGRPLGDGSGEVDLAAGRFTFRGLDFTGGLGGEVWWDVPSGEIGGTLDWPDLPLGGLDEALVALLGGEAALHARFRLPPSGLVEGRLDVAGRGSSATVEADAVAVRAHAEILDAVTGEVDLERDADGGLAGTGVLRLLAAEELLARLAPEADVPLRGHGEASVDVRWPAGGAPGVDGRLLRLELALDQRPLVLREPATFTVSPHGLEVDGLHADLLGEEVFLRGGVSADGGLHGNLSGTLDALLLRFLLPDFEPAGSVTGVVEIHGDVERPLFDGVAEARQLSFRLPGSRDVVAGVDGTLLLSADEIALDGMDFRFMHGQGRGGGTVSWRQGELRLDLAGTVAGVEMEVLPGLVPRLAGSWRLEGAVDDLELAGELTVQRAALARTDDPTSILLDWVEASEEVGPRRRGLGLDLHIQADETLEARTPFLHLTGSADLEVSGTTAEPGMVGSIELEEGGEFTFQGVRYELERGVLTFTDPLRIDPDVDLEARAWIQSYLVTVQIHGTMDRLVPTVTSDPPLPQAEVYSLMALGFRDETLGGGAVGVGLASSVLTREINAELQRRASLLLPVDQLRVDPFAESATGNPTARVTVVKQLNPRWTLILQSNLSANREEVAVSRWFLGRGLFVEATRDIDGTYALDLKLRRRY